MSLAKWMAKRGAGFKSAYKKGQKTAEKIVPESVRGLGLPVAAGAVAASSMGVLGENEGDKKKKKKRPYLED